MCCEMINLGYGLYVEESLLNSLENAETRRLQVYCSPEEIRKNQFEYKCYSDMSQVDEWWCQAYDIRIKKNGNSYYVDVIDYGRYMSDRPIIYRVALEKREGEDYKVAKSYHFQ